MRNMYVIEVRNIDKDGIRYIAVSEKAVAKEDITEYGTLTEKGKVKFGLARTDKAEIVGLEEFDVDTKTFIAQDCHGLKWKYVSAYHRWDVIDE